VDVFHSSGEAAWTSTSTPIATLTKLGGSDPAVFGIRVALSSDGTTALVGALDPDHSPRGAAYIFRASGEGAWASSSAPTATLTNSSVDPKKIALFGPSVGGILSADGATALVGAPGVHLGTGAADVFHVSDESSWASSATPNATLTARALAACVVPRLKGLKLSAAQFALAAGRCRLGRVTKVDSPHRKGRVLSQSRKPGRRLAIGAKVGVRIGK
jgi:hypothetical protein